MTAPFDEILRRFEIAKELFEWSDVRCTAFLEELNSLRESVPEEVPHVDYPESCFYIGMETDLPEEILQEIGRIDAQRTLRSWLVSAQTPIIKTNDEALECARLWLSEPELSDWSFVADFGRDALLKIMTRHEWLDWFLLEQEGSLEDGRAGYHDLILEPIHNPIVVNYADDRLEIEDGWHRSAATILVHGRLPAVVGILKPEPSMANAM